MKRKQGNTAGKLHNLRCYAVFIKIKKTSISLLCFVAGLISNVVDNSFLRPIMVSETISNDYTTKSILNIKNKSEAEKTEKRASEHLSSIRDGFGYSLVFAISEKARSYFSYDGIRTYVDYENDDNFSWYKDFITSGRKYKLDVDADEAANWALSVFINTAVYDENNQLIGVCGVGVDMSELQDLLSRYEQIYNVKIDLINDDGLIMVDSDVSRVNNETISIENLSEYSDGECYYEIQANGDRTITYLENLGWYLIIQNNETMNRSYNVVFMPILICMIISLALLGIVLKLGTIPEDEK